MSTALVDVGAGFADGVLATQATFRVLLDAMARPGRIGHLPGATLRGIEPLPSCLPGAPMSVAMAALLLTLLDAETTIGLRGSFASEAAKRWLRFHTGVKEARPGSEAHVVVRAGELGDGAWASFDCGTDEAPQRGATVLVEVDGLMATSTPDSTTVRLQGPGIETTQRLAVAGVPLAFWHRRIAQQAEFPRGVDLVLVSDTGIAALPRSTRIAIEAH